MEHNRATSLFQRVKINRDNNDCEPMTVVDFFSQTVENFPNHHALASRDQNGAWKKISYCDYRNRVEKIAKVFIKLGLEQRGVVAILAWNCPEWVIAALGAIHCGGVVTGIYTTNSSSACQYILESSKTQILILENSEQLQKINEIKENLPYLKHIIQLSHCNVIHLENAILNWDELWQIDTSDVEAEYERRLEEIVPNECCALIYTSGTSSFPKGAMISHDNLIWDARKNFETMKVAEVGNEILMSYLPLSHAAAFMSDIFLAILGAATVYFTDMETLKGSLIHTLQDIQPTIFISVPRVYEKIEEKLNEKIFEFNYAKRKLFSWAQNIILNHHYNPQTSFLHTLKRDFALRFVIMRVKEVLGFQRCKLFITGSAPLNGKTKKFFITLNMPIFEAYGMTESSTVHSLTSHEIQIYSLETVGKCLAGAQTKILNSNSNLLQEGEICIKGRHVFMGYLNDTEKTMETIDDERWLHTGDIGYIDSNGLLYVTGRLKEILITSGGENIPAVRIENLVKAECNAISNALLVGDKRKFLSILLTLKTEIDEDGKPKDDLSNDTCKWLKSFDINYKRLSELHATKDEKLMNAIQSVIDCVNSKAISNPQRIQKFAILPQDFSVASEELTPTLKVKRFFIEQKYKDIIDRFYE